MQAVRLGMTAVVLASGCLVPNYGSEPFLCNQTGICPEGYACVAGRCTQGGNADGGGSDDLPQFPDGFDAEVPDAAADGGGEDPPPDHGPGDQQVPDQWSPPGDWVEIKAGKFVMGSPPGEPCRGTDEPQHEVTLTRGFAMMATSVTQATFEALGGYRPAGLPACSDCPVANINWHEAASFCNALSLKSGLDRCYDCSGSKDGVTCGYGATYAGAKIYGCPGYRLPTEAEWEYACRAGTTTALFSGPLSTCEQAAAEVEPIAWYSENSGNTTHPVGQKQKNAWGLYDMVGNTWDSCHDRYVADLGTGPVTDPVHTSGAEACMRSGSYGSWPAYLRSANRGSTILTSRFDGRGVRCVRTLP